MLGEVQLAIKAFEGEQVDPLNLLDSYLFESKAAELHLVPEDENNVQKRCVAFTISLTNELRVRLPDNIEALQYISVFNVEETLKHNKSPGEIEKIAKLLGYSPAEIDKIVQQWRPSILVME